MPEPIRRLPDVLVLAAGGALGEAWMRGLLTGLESASGLDFRRCEAFVGTSAGSIVAAALAGGRSPEAGDRAARAYGQAADGPEPAADGGDPLPRPLGALLEAARRGATAATPLAPLALVSAAPGGAIARAAALAAAPRAERTLAGLAEHLDALAATLDGRLRIATVDRASGRRVMFGAPGAPPASVRDAVLASCAVPWIFAPVEIGGREYVDGGVWSPANLDAAPAGRGSEVLCLNPTASLEASRSAYGVLRAVSQAAAAVEAAALRSRGATVRLLAPDPRAAGAMGANLMDPERVEDVLDAAVAQGRSLAG